LLGVKRKRAAMLIFSWKWKLAGVCWAQEPNPRSRTRRGHPFVRDPRERLQDILEAIQHIQRHTSAGGQSFEQDELIQSWCVRHLQIIGEAARSLPDEIRNSIPKIPWSDIIGMRHVLVHNYFGSTLNSCGTSLRIDWIRLKPPLNRF
jgi:uncharacterized protein with HEPN domain